MIEESYLCRCHFDSSRDTPPSCWTPSCRLGRHRLTYLNFKLDKDIQGHTIIMMN